MQELIEVLKDRASSLKEVQATAYVKFVLELQIEELEVCIEVAESLLEKEKEWNTWERTVEHLKDIK